MEGREGMTSGVTVIGAEAPSDYEMVARTENPSQIAGSPAVDASPVSVGFTGTVGKKKRGRPRKYQPDGMASMTLSPMPISSSAPLSGNFSSGKRGRGRPVGSESKQKQKVGSENSGNWSAISDGVNFTPHIITVNAGEDVTMKLISFSQQGPRAVCILSANGVISNVTLRQQDSSGGTLTYEGRFEILSLTGSFVPTESGGTRNRAGGMSVSLASPDGRVVGGGVAGLLIAASPVLVVVGSFLPDNAPVQKPKKMKSVSAQTATPVPVQTTTPPVVTSTAKEEGVAGQGQPSSSALKPDIASPSSIQRENWAGMQSMQDSRKSGTDINISLPGG